MIKNIKNIVNAWVGFRCCVLFYSHASMLEKVEKEEIEERRAHDLSLIQEMQTPY